MRREVKKLRSAKGGQCGRGEGAPRDVAGGGEPCSTAAGGAPGKMNMPKEKKRIAAELTEVQADLKKAKKGKHGGSEGCGTASVLEVVY